MERMVERGWENNQMVIRKQNRKICGYDRAIKFSYSKEDVLLQEFIYNTYVENCEC